MLEIREILEKSEMFDSRATQVLIQRIQDGDETASDALCQRYMARVLAAVRLRLGSRLRAKVESCDIVQEVLVDVIRGAEKFECRSEGTFVNWVNRAVENKIRDEVDRWKARKRDPNREVSQEKTPSPDGTTPLDVVGDNSALTPSRIFFVQEDLECLERAMDRLHEYSEEYHRLIIASEIEGQTYSEIAEVEGKSSDAVRMTINRAKVVLANFYQQLERAA